MLDPSKIENSDGKYIIDDERCIPLDFQRSGIAKHTSDRLFIAQNNGKINVYDMNKKIITCSISQASGGAFKAHKLASSDKYLVVTDRVNKKICVIEIIRNEIKEY